LIYGILLIQEKIRNSSPTSRASWEMTDALPPDRSVLPDHVVEAIAAPFGNSTTQNRGSGLGSTGAVMRPSDRRP
jgi:NADH-quinone oxidoreductase subunit B